MNSYDFNKKIFSSLFLLIFVVHLLILFELTDPTEFDLLEALKLPSPIIILAFIACCGNHIKMVIVKFGFYFLVIHFFVGVIFEIYNSNSFFLDDGRFAILALGRGAAETAWALCVLIVLTEFLQNEKILQIPFGVKALTYSIAVILILWTQSRGALLFIGFYYLLINDNLLKVKKKNFFIGSLIIFSAVILFLNSGVYQLIDRSLTATTVLTGREFIWLTKFADLSSQPFYVWIFGSDLGAKIVDIPEIGYTTADPHNLFLDFFQYYGFFFLLYAGIWYSYLIKYSDKKNKFVLLAFLMMSLFVSSFRYSMVFYVNVLILVLPMIKGHRGQDNEIANQSPASV